MVKVEGLRIFCCLNASHQILFQPQSEEPQQAWPSCHGHHLRGESLSGMPVKAEAGTETTQEEAPDRPQASLPPGDRPGALREALPSTKKDVRTLQAGRQLSREAALCPCYRGAGGQWTKSARSLPIPGQQVPAGSAPKHSPRQDNWKGQGSCGKTSGCGKLGRLDIGDH